MYLMYRGRHTKSVNMEVARPNCHQVGSVNQNQNSLQGSSMVTNHGKHGLTSFVKNVTVEQYIELQEATTPVQAMRTLGYGVSANAEYFWVDDQIKYTIDGKEHVGLVHEVREVTVLVQPISIDFEYNREGRFEKQVLNVADVEEMDMQILDDHWDVTIPQLELLPATNLIMIFLGGKTYEICDSNSIP